MSVPASGSGSIDGSYTPSPHGGSVSVEGEFNADIAGSKGYGLTFGVSGEVSASQSQTTENGITTYTATAEASVSIEAGVELPHGGLSGEATEGVNATYTVSMPEAAATPQALQNANPFDPTSMPVGTTIQMDSEQYSGTQFEATFRAISINGSVQETEGSSFTVERLDDNTVQVTTGPTSGLDVSNGIGVSIGPAGVSMGSQLTMNEATHQVAQQEDALRRQNAMYGSDYNQQLLAQRTGEVQGQRLFLERAGPRAGIVAAVPGVDDDQRPAGVLRPIYLGQSHFAAGGRQLDPHDVIAAAAGVERPVQRDQRRENRDGSEQHERDLEAA